MPENHGENSFCPVPSSAVQDMNLSLEAKGLYSLIRICLDNPDFDFEHVKPAIRAKCKEGGSAEFNSAWEELKKAGYLK